MELRKQLELVEVAFKDSESCAEMTFLDEERGEIRIVKFNKKIFDGVKNEYVPDTDKAKKVDEWCETYFKLAFKELSKAVGSKHDVYCYDNYNSLWESDEVEKFSPDMEGEIYSVTVEEVKMDDIAIRIQYKIDGKMYESKMTFAKYQESLKKWFVDPQKKKKQFEKFEEKFGIPVGELDKLKGFEIMIEIKKAMGKYLYGDVKKLTDAKKKQLAKK